MTQSQRLTLPAGFVGMLALVLGIEATVARKEPTLFNRATLVWSENGKASTRSAANAQIVCFGDSLSLNGLAPAVIENRLGKRVHNLALPRGQAPGHLFMLRRILRAGGKPEAILIDGDALDFDPLHPDLLSAWPALLTFPETAELAWYAHDLSFGQAVASAKALPTFRWRFELRAALTAALAGKPTPVDPEVPPLRRNLGQNHGAYIFPPNAPIEHDPWPALIQNYQPTAWSIHPLNARCLVDFLDLAASQKIRVFWVMPPVRPDFQAQRDRFGRDAAYTRFVDRLARRYPGLVVIDGRHSHYPTSTIADMMHLNRLGAVAFSDAVGRVIGSHLNPPQSADRWVNLPPYRNVSLDPPIEDLTASSAALNRAFR